MSCVSDLGDCARCCGCVGASSVAIIVGVSIAPVVAVVATPFLAIKTLFTHYRYHKFCKNAKVDSASRTFGRIAGQDYTRISGTYLDEISNSNSNQIHASLGSYPKGKKSQEPSPFQTQQDLDWLKTELLRRSKEGDLNFHLKLSRVFAKAIIPIAGVFWAVSEVSSQAPSSMGCAGCMSGAMQTHWHWADALRYHIRDLEERLSRK